MIKDHTIDQCLVELARTMATLKALRAERKTYPACLYGTCADCYSTVERTEKQCECGSRRISWVAEPSRQHAAALRASLDLTRKLADLRQGR